MADIIDIFKKYDTKFVVIGVVIILLFNLSISASILLGMQAYANQQDDPSIQHSSTSSVDYTKTSNGVTIDSVTMTDYTHSIILKNKSNGIILHKITDKSSINSTVYIPQYSEVEVVEVKENGDRVVIDSVYINRDTNVTFT